MSHLVCEAHKRRVLVIGAKVIHRNDASPCPSTLVLAGRNRIDIPAVLENKPSGRTSEHLHHA